MFDDVDRRIIKATQAGLPICAEPYAAVARELGMDAGDVIERMGRMLESGIIRRIGAVPNHYKLGYGANAMTVWDVEDAKVAELGPAVGELDFVSHAYRRPRHMPQWPYNLFAMVHGRDQNEVNEKAAQIKSLLGDACRASEMLLSTRILKKTGLRLVA